MKPETRPPTTQPGANVMASTNGGNNGNSEAQDKATRERADYGALTYQPTMMPLVTVGETLPPEAQQLMPLINDVIRTSPRDLGQQDTRLTPRAPEFVGKPDGVQVLRK